MKNNVSHTFKEKYAWAPYHKTKPTSELPRDTPLLPHFALQASPLNAKEWEGKLQETKEKKCVLPPQALAGVSLQPGFSFHRVWLNEKKTMLFICCNQES